MTPDIDAIRRSNMRQLADTGAFRVQAIKAKSAVESYTQALQKQDVVFRGWRKNAQLRNDVLKEQYRLQRMSVMGWKEDGMGRISADMIVPRDVPARLGNFRAGLADVRAGQASLGNVLDETRMRIGLWSQGVSSASKNLVNWGKNTQWAGRQMMVGLTLPFAALAAGTGALAYQLDKEMTRVLKVYDYATTSIEAEGERLKQTTMDTARSVANMYGQSAKDTIGIIADLAAAGRSGDDLQQTAKLVSRASMLGELNRDDAIKTTISLQEVFMQSNEKLAVSFDYLNALENNTTLSMKDMTVAIPKLSGVVKSLGGDYKDMGTMMAAAKAAGLNAPEAANMLKTAMFRAVSPYGKGKETFFEKTNIDLTKLVATTKGEAIPTFVAIGEAMEGLSNIDKNAVLKDVFGVYQGSKAGQFIEQMTNLKNEATAAGKAAKVALMTDEQLAAISAREVERQRASASGKFKIALESIKVELADIGEPFLKIATTIIKGVTKIFSAFNGLSDTKKQVVLFGLAFLAIIGPIVMITGVMATLIGTIIKFGAAMLMMSTRFKATNADQMSAALLAKGSSSAFRDEATAAQLLSYQLAQVNNKLTMMAGSALAAKRALAGVSAGASVAGGGVVGAAARRGTTSQVVGGVPQIIPTPAPTRIPKGQPGAGRYAPAPALAPMPIIGTGIGTDPRGRTSPAKGQPDMDRTAAGAEKANRSIKGMNGGLTSSVGLMAMMAAGTNTWVMYLGMGLMMLPLIAPMLGKAFGAVGKGIGSVIGKTSTLGKGIAGLAPLMGPLGIALLAAGAGFAFMQYKAKKAREEAQALADTSKGIAGAMGVELLAVGEYRNEKTGEKEDLGKSGIADKFKKENAKATEELVKLGKMADKEILKNRVLKIGMDVYNATGDAKKAKLAVDAALLAAGNPSINVDVNFANENWRNEVSQQLLQGLGEASKNAYNTDGWFDAGMDEKVKVQLKEQAETLGRSMGQFIDGKMDLAQLKAQFDAVGDVYANGARGMVENFQGEFSKFDKNTIEQFVGKDATSDEIARALLVNDKFYTSMSISSGAGGKLAAEMQGLRDTYALLSKETMGTTNTQNLQGAKEEDLVSITQNLKSNTIGASGATKKLGDTAEGAVVDLNSLEGAMISVEDATDKLFDAQKSLMTNAWGTVLDNASDQIEARHDASIETMENSSKKRLEAIEAEAKLKEKDFDRRGDELDARQKTEDKTFTSAWDTRTKSVEKSYDDRVKAIEKTMEAEEKAEALRQKMFESEKSRIQRLSELYNQNVDFNVALNSGDMDEAAKIANGMQASQSQWAIDDAAETSTDANAATTEKRQTEINNINTAKTTRIEQLKDEEDAAKLALQTRQEREKKALEDEKNRYTESVEARRAAEEKKTQAAVDGSNKRYEAAKKALDAEMAALRAFIPRNEAELREYIGRIEGNYKKHELALDTNSVAWSKSVGTAMANATAVARTELGNEARWNSMGEAIGEDIAKGMLGMTFPQFMNWMTTGELPKPEAPKASNTSYTAQQEKLGQGRHSGGPIGTADSSRAGRPLSAGLYADEVPIIAQKGEFMMQRSAVKEIGVDNLHALNKGALKPDRKGKMHQGGIVGGIGAMFKAGIQKGIANTMAIGAQRKASELAAAGKYDQIPTSLQGALTGGYSAGAAGKYGGSVFDVSQLQNAATIAGVGRNMGASPRDIMIALMTAMQESGLRNLNYGDRDSVGLFQQRTSQGWGTIEQIMTPSYSAGKFFEGLLKIEDRGSMSLSQAAQAVQRSAFPDAYAKWEDEARAIMSGGVVAGEPIAGGPMMAGLLPGSYQSTSPFSMNGGKVTGDVQGMNMSFMQRLAKWSASVGQPYNVGSGYRSMAEQQVLYNRYLAGVPGQAKAAKPGSSNHNFGLASDGPHWGGLNPGAFGLTYPMSYEPWHVEPVGARALRAMENAPGLKVGGEIKYDNTIANLHKDETVLTAPLSKQLREGIGNIDAGAGNEYNITMDFRGAVVREEVDIERAVAKVLQAQETKMGRKRTIK